MKDHNKKNLVRRMISEVHKVVASQSVSPPRDQSRLVTPMTLNFRFPNLKPSPNASPLKSPEKEKQVNKVTFRRKSILPAVEIVKKTRTTFVKKKKYVKDGLSPVTDPVKQLSRFDCELTKILAQRYKSYNQPSLGSMDTKRYTPFEKAFSSLTKLSKCNLDNYLDSVSYFNKSREEVSTLYNAINEPERNKHGFGSIFNIPVNQYLTESQSQELNKENQKKVINDLYNILLDLDSSIELPKKVPSYTKLEELISPRIFEKSLKYKSLSDFKKVYEDPRNDPKFKIKTDPFKSPKNQQEQSYNNLLTQIDLPFTKPKDPRYNISTKRMGRIVTDLFNNDTLNSDATVQSLTLPKPSAQYNHERALKNWSKLKSILKMSMFAFGNAKGSIKYKLKKIAQEGKLKEVVTLTETTLKEKQEKKRIDKTYKLYKSIKNQTKFVRLLNYEDEISQLQDISHENSFQFMKAIDIMTTIINYMDEPNAEKAFEVKPKKFTVILN